MNTTTRMMVHHIIKIERSERLILNKDSGNYYKSIELTFTDEKGVELVFNVFSDDISLGIEGVKS